MKHQKGVKMDKKLYNITLDGRLDEPAWETAKVHTDFRFLRVGGGQLDPSQTLVKFLSCEDRVYIGIKCMVQDMAYVTESYAKRSIYGTERVEVLIAPSGRSMDFYQFLLTFGGKQETADTVTGCIMQGAAVLGYIIAEGRVDQENAANYQPKHEADED
jgi:hypothetical protein